MIWYAWQWTFSVCFQRFFSPIVKNKNKNREYVWLDRKPYLEDKDRVTVWTCGKVTYSCSDQAKHTCTDELSLSVQITNQHCTVAATDIIQQDEWISGSQVTFGKLPALFICCVIFDMWNLSINQHLEKIFRTDAPFSFPRWIMQIRFSLPFPTDSSRNFKVSKWFKTVCLQGMPAFSSQGDHSLSE